MRHSFRPYTPRPPQCNNCFKRCPRLHEVDICKRMAREKTHHRAAAAHVRRLPDPKSLSASRLRKLSSPSAPQKKLQEKTPVQSSATVLPVGPPEKSVVINSYLTALEVGKVRNSLVNLSCLQILQRSFHHVTSHLISMVRLKYFQC